MDTTAVDTFGDHEWPRHRVADARFGTPNRLLFVNTGIPPGDPFLGNPFTRKDIVNVATSLQMSASGGTVPTPGRRPACRPACRSTPPPA